jgi:hypothetical protein
MARAQKVSISADAKELKWLRLRAKRVGGDLSAVFAEATRLLRQRDARKRVLLRFGKDAGVSAAEAEAIRREWRA